MVRLELEDCVHDSPLFRSNLAHAEETTNELHALLGKLQASTNAQMEASRQLRRQQERFRADLAELTRSQLASQRDEDLAAAMRRFTEALSEVSSHSEMLEAQMENGLVGPLNDFLQHDMKRTWRSGATNVCRRMKTNLPRPQGSCRRTNTFTGPPNTRRRRRTALRRRRAATCPSLPRAPT